MDEQLKQGEIVVIISANNPSTPSPATAILPKHYPSRAAWRDALLAAHQTWLAPVIAPLWDRLLGLGLRFLIDEPDRRYSTIFVMVGDPAAIELAAQDKGVRFVTPDREIKWELLST